MSSQEINFWPVYPNLKSIMGNRNYISGHNILEFYIALVQVQFATSKKTLDI